jgi:hypothetical protein
MSEKNPLIDSPIAKWFLAIISIIGLAWGFYGNYHTKSPRLLYEIQSRAVLFNRTDALSSVHLYVDSLDVLNSNQNISVFTFKVSNRGSQNMTVLDYDEGAFGIKIIDGIVLKEATIGDASNEHILERYQDLAPNTLVDFVEIPRIALDKGDWYTFSVAILHEYDIPPQFEPIGKIIGQSIIEIVPTSTEKMPFWEQIFYGGIFINLIRAVLYLIIAISLILIILSIAMTISESFDNRKRERVRNQIARNPEIQAFIRDDFISNEDRVIRIADHYYGLGDKRINKLYNNAKKFISNPDNLDKEPYDKYRSIYRDINRLVSLGYLLMGDNAIITVPRESKESVLKVNEVLKKYKYETYKNRFFAEFYDGMDFPNISIEESD